MARDALQETQGPIKLGKSATWEKALTQKDKVKVNYTQGKRFVKKVYVHTIQKQFHMNRVKGQGTTGHKRMTWHT